jgi:glycosyltransferase involved in cell wall biosynthesis
MRICHVINSLDPRGGGPPLIALSLASAQAAAGHQTTVLAYGSAAEADLVPHVSGSSLINLHTVASNAPGEAVLGRTILHAFKQLGRFDIVHLHGLWEPLFPRIAKVCQESATPYVVLINGMLHPWSLAQKRFKKKLAMTLMTRRYLNEAAALQCGNEAEAQFIEPMGFTSPRVILPNGIWPMTPEQRPVRGAFYARFPQLRDDPFALFLGRLTQKKGLDILLEAFESAHLDTPHAWLVIAGPPSDFDVHAAVANLKSRHRILLAPPQWGPEKYQALNDARCFVLPSRQEGFPVAVLEAISIGTPAILSPECNFPQVEHYGAGVVVDLRADLWAQQLRILLSNPPKFLNMARAGVRLVETQFSWPRVAAKSIALYERILHMPRYALRNLPKAT